MNRLRYIVDDNNDDDRYIPEVEDTLARVRYMRCSHDKADKYLDTLHNLHQDSVRQYHRSENGSSNQMIAELRQMLIVKESAIAALDAQNQRLEHNIQAQKETINNLTTELNNVNQHKNQLSEDLTRVRAQRSTFNKQALDYKQQLDQLKVEFQTIQDELETTKQELHDAFVPGTGKLFLQAQDSYKQLEQQNVELSMVKQQVEDNVGPPGGPAAAPIIEPLDQL